MAASLANENDLYFERGGPTYRLLQRIGLIRRDDPSVKRRILCLLLVTWFPLLLLTAFEGHALGPTPRQSFLLDFATYARFFVAAPLLIVAELIVGPWLRTAGLRFVDAGFVQPSDYPAFDTAIERVARWRESYLAEAVIVFLAFSAAWSVSPDLAFGGDSATWVVAKSDGGLQFTLAGLWYKFIAMPLVQLLLMRWLWRLMNWARFLASVASMKLDLSPTHADQAAGLGFLGTAHASLGIFAFALSSVLSADAAFRILFEGTSIDTFRVPAIVFLIASLVVCLGPLFLFVPIMAKKRREALQDYSSLVLRYNRAFHEKWVSAPADHEDPLLGSADIQSLADLGNSFEFIRSMRLFPFSLRVAIQIAVVAALPTAPLLPLVMPWSDIAKLLMGIVF
jgi:hypothetical protein